MNIIDPYYKKTVPYKFEGNTFEFKVSQDLFSSLEVDHGTQRVLRTFLFEKIDSFKKVLDLGCGYGPIGIVLKKICPEAQVHMTDRDALAVEYAKANAELNGVAENTFCYGSLGYDSVKDTDFDLIISNIPAKVGEHVLTHMLKDAKSHLVKNGRVVIVVIDAINDYIHKELTTDETIQILYHKAWPGHHVYHYTFTEEAYKDIQLTSAFERGEYARQKNTFIFQGKQLTLDTTFHLSEYDQLSYDSELLLSQLGTITEKLENIVIFNPGQGYVPLAVMKQYNPQKLFLVDRDLQALIVSQENLVSNGYAKEHIEIHHQVGLAIPQTNIDAVIGVLPKKQELAVYDMFTEQEYSLLKPDGYFILSSTSTVITRVLSLASKKFRFKVLERIKEKGRSLVILEK
ncbi:MAG TPA: methyltransferase [Candidatus Saccharimonadales bacterium]|nr:methyltransferase [Candidatus Saccharimonadales bacterium]